MKKIRSRKALEKAIDKAILDNAPMKTLRELLDLRQQFPLAKLTAAELRNATRRQVANGITVN